MFETIANDLEYAEAERLMRKLLARHPLDNTSVRVIGTMHNLLVHQMRLEGANANVGARDKAA
jgi:hypothetical protein